MYTLNLFKHEFPLATTHADKAETLRRWSSKAVVDGLHRTQGSRPLFLLHDGPPYANGGLHLGHAVNKGLKDSVVKFKRLQGYFAPYVPGFDCHGLPVELEVERVGHGKDDPPAFVAACRSYARSQVDLQTAQFRDLGVAADWEQPYLTMAPGFESGAAKVFQALPGAVRRLRPVHWCPACASSLAEAEVEYKTKVGDSLVVLFPVVGHEDLFLDVWTTTPYTLPANKAVAYNPALSYVAVSDGTRNRVRLRQAGDEQLPDVDLAGLTVVSPYTRDAVPVLPADFVSRAGTGLVHMAPAFGTDDFRVCEPYGLAVEQYLDEHGRFVVAGMQGMDLAQARAHVLERVAPFVVSVSTLEHEYPHCWRHKTPVFFRASQEWFLDLADTRQQALRALDDVEFVPAAGRERLTSMLAGRGAWCVSRNRLWGTPLVDPADPDDLRLAARVATEGVEAWQSEGPRRTLDVWFDSGVTHQLVLMQRYGRTADVYLEGSDQHRGWFQSSLLTCAAAGHGAPYKQVVTHGFVVDGTGQKFSKSSKNYQPLDQMLKTLSPDVLRLWTLQQDFTRELKFSGEALALTKERFRKLRNTMRFCLQNLQDFDWQTQPVSHPLDRVQVALLRQLGVDVCLAADRYDFAAAVSHLLRYAESASSDYFPAVKDSLYCDRPDAPRRRQAQQVLGLVVRTLVRLLTPVLPYSCEEVFQYLRAAGAEQGDSVLLATLADVSLPVAENEAATLAAYGEAVELKGTLNRWVEAHRDEWVKGAAQVNVTWSQAKAARLGAFSDVLGAAAVFPDDRSDDGGDVSFTPTSWRACACCRKHEPSVSDDTDLCTRCAAVQGTVSEALS
ncbi:isoleucine--tRNA ligase [Achromobacter marplatensis]|uniref:isoleucine--tRNA ligase n=1 Tax=Achromobacter marplatensis TaxID=470868 RepID=A0ABX9GCF6_9BURK|nr:class I tRNA ligase family protein [Achromobacter marplatensis]OWT67001.1 isoleucine--tRNA ligase [Achromobacter marplatensis]RBP19076.1 isoleucyl-tRNA synthetase [Achromobacter marplatensis]CAB3650772.1 Isoleucine--tRNA ligase [Achromobacter marplatensis]